jgi:diguanylate cyclase (GGDEF)-like protein
MALLSAALMVATGMFSTALARLGERQRSEARRDSLTGCLNRRAFAQRFGIEAERSRRLGMGVGILFLDIDRFKSLNDAHGHAAGDLVLRRLAERIERSLRETDLLFRWGGEEFVVLMPHTSASEVGEVGERVRAAVAGAPLVSIVGSAELTATVSIGAAAATRSPFDSGELLQAADEACYSAKRMGRDRVIVAGA